jgi:ComF family protein
MEMPKAVCPFCQEEGSHRACHACRQETFLDGLLALFLYGDPVVRKVLTTWKYVGDKEAKQIVERWVRQRADVIAPWCRDSVMVPVPLHVSKRHSRGFDQAQEMVRMVNEEVGGRSQDLLFRCRRTLPQARRRQEERLVGDLDGIFRVAGDVPERVVLCDDVFTSGATMDAAAKCLKEHGAKEVTGLVIARGSVGA